MYPKFASVINSQIKLHWAETHWDREEYATAKAWVEETVRFLNPSISASKY
jgi:hypothetical protein